MISVLQVIINVCPPLSPPSSLLPQVTTSLFDIWREVSLDPCRKRYNQMEFAFLVADLFLLTQCLPVCWLCCHR